MSRRELLKRRAAALEEMRELRGRLEELRAEYAQINEDLGEAAELERTKRREERRREAEERRRREADDWRTTLGRWEPGEADREAAREFLEAWESAGPEGSRARAEVRVGSPDEGTGLILRGSYGLRERCSTRSCRRAVDRGSPFASCPVGKQGKRALLCLRCIVRLASEPGEEE